MILNEAIEKVLQHTEWDRGVAVPLVKALQALGLLHLAPAVAGQDDAVRIAAAERLVQAHTQIFSRNDSAIWGKMTRDGAYEILDVLLKSGFKITHD